MENPIERFYPTIWNSDNAPHNEKNILPAKLKALPFFTEPYEDATRVARVPATKFSKVQQAFQEPTHVLHPSSPDQMHSFSEEGKYRSECDAPTDFFETIFGSSQLKSIVRQTNVYI